MTGGKVAAVMKGDAMSVEDNKALMRPRRVVEK